MNEWMVGQVGIIHVRRDITGHGWMSPIKHERCPAGATVLAAERHLRLVLRSRLGKLTTLDALVFNSLVPQRHRLATHGKTLHDARCSVQRRRRHLCWK